jgi:hypothetical protein
VLAGGAVAADGAAERESNLEYTEVGPGRACKMQAWVKLGLYSGDLGFCGPGLVYGLGVWTVGLAQKPGLGKLGIYAYVVCKSPTLRYIF